MAMSDTKMIYLFIIIAMWITKSRIHAERHIQKAIDDANAEEKSRLRKKVKAQFGALRSVGYNAMHNHTYNDDKTDHKDKIVVVREMETQKRSKASYLHIYNKSTDTYLFKMLLDEFVDDLIFEDVGNGGIDEKEVAQRAQSFRTTAINEIEKLCGKNEETEAIIHQSLTFAVVLQMYRHIIMSATLIRTDRNKTIREAQRSHRIAFYPNKKKVKRW